MMKKLLVLSMIALIAVSAQATITLDIEVGGVDYSGQELEAGTVVTVKVIQDAEKANASGGLISVDFDGSNPTVQDTTPPAAYVAGDGWGGSIGWNWGTSFGVSVDEDPQAVFDYQANKQVTTTLGGATPGIGSSLLQQTYFGVIPPQPYVATFILTFEVTKSTDVTLGGEWDGVAVSGFETVNMIPEPITVALLGLGGLFVRRK